MFLLQVEQSDGTWKAVEQAHRKPVLIGARGAHLARNPGAVTRIVQCAPKPKADPLGAAIARMWLKGTALGSIDRFIADVEAGKVNPSAKPPRKFKKGPSKYGR